MTPLWRRRPRWSVHAPWLGLWLRLTPEARDGRGSPYSGVAEQTDALVRAVLEKTDLDDLLREDAHAAFAAFTVGETFRTLARDAALVAERMGVPPATVVMAVLTAALQRFAWHAARHYAPAYPQPEPFGASVHLSELPPLVTKEKSA